jgi:PAS fold
MQRSAVFAGRHGATEGLAGRTATAESADDLCALSAPGNVSKRSSSTFRPSSSSRTRDFRFILLNRAGVEFLDVYPIIGTTDHDVIPKEEVDHFVARDREVLKSRHVEIIEEEPVHTPHNGLRFLRTGMIIICDEPARRRSLCFGPML